jgi:hypothetical protein
MAEKSKRVSGNRLWKGLVEIIGDRAENGGEQLTGFGCEKESALLRDSSGATEVLTSLKIMPTGHKVGACGSGRGFRF